MTTLNDKATPQSASTKTAAHIDITHIKTGMPIVCSQNGAVGIVDRMEGKSSIKVNKDGAGVHHYIPIAWVMRVDQTIHLDRPRDQAMREWSKTAFSG